MKFLSLVLGILLFGAAAFAQTPAPNEFQLTRITRNLITSPVFSYSGAEDFPIENTQGRWVEVEAEFVSVPELTDEFDLQVFHFVQWEIVHGRSDAY